MRRKPKHGPATLKAFETDHHIIDDLQKHLDLKLIAACNDVLQMMDDNIMVQARLMLHSTVVMMAKTINLTLQGVQADGVELTVEKTESLIGATEKAMFALALKFLQEADKP